MRRTQIGWVIIGVIIFVDALVLLKSWDIITTAILPGVSAIILLLFFRLTITVDDRYVKFSFGIGLIHGKYQLDHIENCKPLNYIPLGWGIRIRPGVIIYNVSGNKAIELVIKNKKRKVWLGTNSPVELSEYIDSKLPTG